MINAKKTAVISLILGTWIILLGTSLNPLSWGGHAVNTVFPTNMLDLTEPQAAFLDAEFEAFVNRTGEIDYYFPADWYTDPIIGPTIPYRIELMYLDLYFEEMFNIENVEEIDMPFSYYYTASQVFNQREFNRAGRVVFVTSYLIHRGYDTWVYVASTKAWAEVYLTNDWRAEYTFGDGGRYYDRDWLIKFNDTVQIYSLISYVGQIIFKFIIALVFVASFNILYSLIYNIYKKLQTSHESREKGEKTLSGVVQEYLFVTMQFISYTVMLPVNFVKEVAISLKEEIILFVS
ncbi:MAG: hypothetical protein ACFFD4_39295, partial [Candidatus Odinarchaeota archaeon]